jgi:cell pole-organizing protein PopZ
MSDAKSPQDLSMDEILATIRRIIAEDERSSGTPAPPARPVRETAPAPPPGADDVLDLTDTVNEDDSGQHPAPVVSAPVGSAPLGAVSGAAMREPAPPPLAATTSPGPAKDAAKPDNAAPETVPGTERPAAAGTPADRAAAPAPSPPPGANDERLVSEVAMLAAATAFGRLASVPRTRRESPQLGGRPLDDIVRELLRPLLQTWLDENLPGIVERLVEAEIARISARSGSG